MANCPRCRQALVDNQVDEFTVRLCVPCKGILLPHAELVKILERSWHAVTPEQAEKAEFLAAAAVKAEPAFACPDCGKPMEKYGYMGMSAIEIDHCDQCELMWLDADELQNMVLALAKDNYRSARALKREREASLDLGAALPLPTGTSGIRQFSECPENHLPRVAVQVILGLLLR
jgi:Zn-finger nucleic acid-binding protein